jgi:hypothetical protein
MLILYPPENSGNQFRFHLAVLAREDVTLTGSLPAVILDVEGFAGPTRTLITILNGNVIYVSGYGDLERFEAIALSLRAE